MASSGKLPWGSSNAAQEPKRAFRWWATFGSSANEINSYCLRSFQKPSFEIAVSEYLMVNEVNYRPGVLSWNPIEITLIDGENQKDNNSSKLFNLIKKGGYRRSVPSAPISAIEKRRMQSALGGQVTFQQIDANGKIIEKWQILHPFITSIDFGAGNYSSDEIMTISLTLRYDDALLKLGS